MHAHTQTHFKTDEQKESAQPHGKLNAGNVVHYECAALLRVMHAEEDSIDDYRSAIRIEWECQIIGFSRRLLRNN